MSGASRRSFRKSYSSIDVNTVDLERIRNFDFRNQLEVNR